MVEGRQRIEPETHTFAQVGGRDVQCDVYRPLEQGEPGPAVLLLFGGGWRTGSKAMMAGLAPALARRGYTAVAADYRLTEVAMWPAQIDDVNAVLDWMHEHASMFNIDRQKVVVWGQSSGGHLGLLAAGNRGDIAACIAFYPPLIFEPSMGTAWDNYTPHLMENPTAEDWRALSPLSYLTSKFPPTLLFHGANDEMVSVDHTLRFYDALREQGVPAELHIYADAPHGYDMDRTLGRHGVETAVLFLSRYAPIGEPYVPNVVYPSGQQAPS